MPRAAPRRGRTENSGCRCQRARLNRNRRFPENVIGSFGSWQGLGDDRPLLQMTLRSSAVYHGKHRVRYVVPPSLNGPDVWNRFWKLISEGKRYTYELVTSDQSRSCSGDVTWTEVGAKNSLSNRRNREPKFARAKAEPPEQFTQLPQWQVLPPRVPSPEAGPKNTLQPHPHP